MSRSQKLIKNANSQVPHHQISLIEDLVVCVCVCVCEREREREREKEGGREAD